MRAMDDTPWRMLASAALTGLVFGYVLQRGGFCLTRAISNALLIGDGAILRAYALALLVAMVGVHVLMAAGLVEIPLRPFRWLANVGGGLAFGVGMILSGGCSGSTWYRVGEGAIGAWVVLLGFAIGATTASVGALAPLRAALQRPAIALADGGPPTVASALGLSPWIVIGALAVAAAVWFARGGGEPEHGKWPWPLTGVAVGAVIAAGWWASSIGAGDVDAPAARPAGITFASNTGHLLSYVMVGFPNRVTWSMVMLLGVPAGAGIAAWRAREFRWKLPPGWSLVKIFAGGLLMGAAALVGEGCNINQGLTNSATLAVGSLVTFAAMMAGAAATLWVLYIRRG